MLLYLDASLAQALNDDSASTTILDALENIALALYEGSHLVHGTRLTLKTLSTNNSLSERARRCYRRQYEKLPQQGCLMDRLAYRMEITAYGPVAVKENGRVASLPASWFALSSVSQKTVFLCENLVDEALLQQIGRLYIASQGWSRLDLRTDPRLGGGSTTGPVYRDIQDRCERLCFCLVDSDRKAPEMEPGNTAKAVIDADDQAQHLCGYAVLNVREGENLIPNAVFAEARGQDPRQMEALNFLTDLANTPAVSCRPYLDMKDGLKLGKLHHANPESALARYWLDILPRLPRSSIKQSCRSNPKCADPGSCQCLIFSGFGGQVLSDSTQQMKKTNPNELRNMLDEELVQEWTRIGEWVTAWFCAGHPLRAT